MSQQVQTFMVGTAHLRYLLHLPPHYSADKTTRFPLILCLHGAGERGSDLDLVREQGIPQVVEQQPDLPFITVAPQCPAGTMWSLELDTLALLLDDVSAHYRVDPARVYLTGMGMGGYGTWNLAIAQPQRFTAIAPICGGGDPDTVCVLNQMPVWAFHGALDNVVLLREGRKMVDALRECGGSVRFTIYPNLGHDSWTRTYSNPRLYEWFLSHSRER